LFPPQKKWTSRCFTWPQPDLLLAHSQLCYSLLEPTIFSKMSEEKVCFANLRGQTLNGVVHHPEAGIPRGGIILCHGMESNKESDKLVLLSRELAQRNL